MTNHPTDQQAFQKEDRMTDYTALVERLKKLAETEDQSWVMNDVYCGEELLEAAEAISTLERELAEREEERAVLWRKNRELHSTLNVEKAAITTLQSELAEATDWRKLAIHLAMREADYRLNHDVHGDGDMRVGRAWDRMRHAGDTIREAVGIMDTPHD